MLIASGAIVHALFFKLCTELRVICRPTAAEGSVRSYSAAQPPWPRKRIVVVGHGAFFSALLGRPALPFYSFLLVCDVVGT